MPIKLTQERIKELFIYTDGDLFRIKSGHNMRIGKKVGCINAGGYKVTQVDGKLYKNSRLIFLYHYGYMPENFIDHIDRNKCNDRIENLREVSNMCNLRNSKPPITNTSGIKGVRWDKSRNMWCAAIMVARKMYQLGRYLCFTEAVAHRLAAEQCLNWEGCDTSSTALQYIKNMWLIDGK